MLQPPPLSPDALRSALAFARAILLQGARLPAGDERSVAAAVGFAADLAPQRAAQGFALFVQALDRAALLYTKRRFSELHPEDQQRLLVRWQDDPLLSKPLWALSFLFKASHFDAPEIYEAMGHGYRKGGPAKDERWLEQILSGDEVQDGDRLDCDVVIVGSGPGGAVVGRELAAKGLAVVFLEEGDLHRRGSFRGSVLESKRRFYRHRAQIMALGNAAIPVFMGRLVGGSSAINTATCFRPPDRILHQWCERLQTDELSPQALAPHFDRVEQMLWVETAKPEHWGGLARVLARGCDRLGWRHAAVRRNAPDCIAEGVCDFGCPSGGRRGVDVAYIPSALIRGAVLFTGLRGRRVLLDAGRAAGVEAESVRTGAKLKVHARAVVLAGGAIPTPLLLIEQGIGNSSGEVGKNLSLHPACSVSALFDEQIRQPAEIPQSYYCDEHHDEGILILGAMATLSLAGVMFPVIGRPLTEVLERFEQVASVGVMIEDDSRGRVRSLGGRPLITYRLSRSDTERLQRGMAHAAEIFLAAGATHIYPMVQRLRSFAGRRALEDFTRLRLRPWDFLLCSFHPLGTCSLGQDPRTSVVGLDHETHDVKNLFIVDGSTVPGPPAVNPQITIMALADRAAAKIAAKLGA